MDGRVRTVALLMVAIATVPLLVGTTIAGLAPLVLAAVGATVVVAWGLPRAGVAYDRIVLGLVGVGVALAVVSILTGWLNGLSDEPYSTPAYASLGLAMYTKPVMFAYVQYGAVHFETSYDVYLPLLTYVQVPGLDYRWVALAAWGGTLYLVRGDRFALAGWATPWIPVLAANGQNDFVPLLALSLAIAIPRTRGSWLAEIVALGLKQFANVIVVIYHVARREYLRALLAGAVTVAILLPFLWVSPEAVYCHVVLGDPTNGCAPHSAGFVLFKRNYWLYPTWIGLVFHGPIVRWVRKVAGRPAATGA